jgi:hypothetical protein
VREYCLDLTRTVTETPPRERLSPEDGVTRRLNAAYWRRHPQMTDHNARGLLEGGPGEFSGNLSAFIADSLSGCTVESPRTARNRQKLQRINARRKARERASFVAAVLSRRGR